MNLQRLLSLTYHREHEKNIKVNSKKTQLELLKTIVHYWLPGIICGWPLPWHMCDQGIATQIKIRKNAKSQRKTINIKKDVHAWAKFS